MKFGINTTLFMPFNPRLKMKSIFILPIVMLLLILTSCGDSTPENAVNAANEELPLDFVNFYEIFHTDSVFQKKHIVFPLQGVPPIDSQTMDQVSAFMWPANG